MSMMERTLRLAETVPWPDMITRTAIDMLVSRTGRRLAQADGQTQRRFARDMTRSPIALHTAEANAQHYEVPAGFFELVLGPQRKYSCCLYADGDTPAQAEERALTVTAERAALADGQHILELGCGWGSLSLWMARHYPSARIVAVSNSRSQRAFIAAHATAQGLRNLEVVTADMNDFAPSGRFDRVVSVEMFEHMANWRALLTRVRTWLAHDGRLFLHVFAHRQTPYRFDAENRSDWIARHFFTGGVMPSHGLIREFGDCLAVEAEWRWSGQHYQRTALDWLANYDRNADAIAPILRSVYGADAPLWQRRWRMFFLAVAGLFGHDGGDVWGVSHYRLRPVE
jgi:cyclopropane-fatty-acyl-phospholipid synthase